MTTQTLANLFEQPPIAELVDNNFDSGEITETARLANAQSIESTRSLVNTLLTNAWSQMLDVSLTDILVGAWNKVSAIQAFATGDKLASDETHKFVLTEHKIESKHNPKVELFVREQKIGEVSISVNLTLLLGRTTLMIRHGRIMEIRISGAQASGDISCLGQKLIEKKTKELELPAGITLGEGVPIPPRLDIITPQP